MTLNDAPANAKGYQTTKLARDTIAKAGKLKGSERGSALRHAAGQLRRTLEEIVQCDLFKDVIARWRENLMITKVRQIRWDYDVADEIDALFADLSRYVEAHSHTEEYAGGETDLDDLEAILKRVDAVIIRAKEQR